jgi:hypothetical protein
MFYVSTSETEQQKPSGLLQPLLIDEWKWERVTTDFVTGYQSQNKIMMQFGL